MRAAFHIIGSGFTQNRGYFHGILRLREKLISDGCNEGIKSRVWYLPWDADFKQVAADLSNICSYYGIQPLVNLSGYSYGGCGMVKLSWELHQRGIPVQYMTLSDPVHRIWWLPKPLPAASSMLGRQYSYKLKIPSTVLNLQEYYQTNNRPQGHRLIVSKETYTEPAIKLNYKHQQMDDAPEFHGCVRKYAKNINTLVTL